MEVEQKLKETVNESQFVTFDIRFKEDIFKLEKEFENSGIPQALCLNIHPSLGSREVALLRDRLKTLKNQEEFESAEINELKIVFFNQWGQHTLPTENEDIQSVVQMAPLFKVKSLEVIVKERKIPKESFSYNSQRDRPKSYWDPTYKKYGTYETLFEIGDFQMGGERVGIPAYSNDFYKPFRESGVKKLKLQMDLRMAFLPSMMPENIEHLDLSRCGVSALEIQRLLEQWSIVQENPGVPNESEKGRSTSKKTFSPRHACSLKTLVLDDTYLNYYTTSEDGCIYSLHQKKAEKFLGFINNFLKVRPDFSGLSLKGFIEERQEEAGWVDLSKEIERRGGKTAAQELPGISKELWELEDNREVLLEILSSKQNSTFQEMLGVFNRKYPLLKIKAQKCLDQLMNSPNPSHKLVVAKVMMEQGDYWKAFEVCGFEKTLQNIESHAEACILRSQLILAEHVRVEGNPIESLKFSEIPAQEILNPIEIFDQNKKEQQTIDRLVAAMRSLLPALQHSEEGRRLFQQLKHELGFEKGLIQTQSESFIRVDEKSFPDYVKEILEKRRLNQQKVTEAEKHEKEMAAQEEAFKMRLAEQQAEIERLRKEMEAARSASNLPPVSSPSLMMDQSAPLLFNSVGANAKMKNLESPSSGTKWNLPPKGTLSPKG